MKRQKLLRCSGFTIIELLVTINVIAILFLVLANLLPRIGYRVKTGRAAQCARHTRRLVEDAEALYIQQHDGERSSSLQALVEADYLTALPQCSSGGEFVWLTDSQEPVLGCSIHFASIPDNPLALLFTNAFNDLTGLKITTGAWSAISGWLTPSTTKTDNRIYMGSAVWDDQDIRVTAKLNSGAGYGIYYRVDGKTKPNGYIFKYNPGSKKFTVQTVVNGTEKTVFQSATIPKGFSTYSTHDIRINVEGDSHQIYIDGNLIFNFKDSTYSSGTVGLRTWSKSNAAFDSLKVVDPTF